MTKQLSFEFHLTKSYTRDYVPFNQDIACIDEVIKSTQQVKQSVFFIRGSACSGKSAFLTYLCRKVTDFDNTAGLIDLSRLSKSSYFEAVINEIYNVDLLCIDNVDDYTLDTEQADCLLNLFSTLPEATLVFTSTVANDNINNSALRDFIMAFLQQKHMIKPPSVAELQVLLRYWATQAGQPLDNQKVNEFCVMVMADMSLLKRDWLEFCSTN